MRRWPDCLDVYAVALHEMGHYIGLAHQPRNHEHVMCGATIWPPVVQLTQCDADNARRLYNPSRIGYPVDNSYDCSRFTGVVEEGPDAGGLVITSDGGEFVAGYSVRTNSRVRLDLVDALGRMVAHVADAVQPAGSHNTALPTAGLASGLYFLVLRTDAGIFVQQLFIQ